MSNVTEIRRQFASEHGFVLPDYVCQELSRLTAELAEAKKEIERLGTELANYNFRFIQKERENSNLRMALAARDVIIGVKDGALKDLLNVIRMIEVQRERGQNQGWFSQYTLECAHVALSRSLSPNEVAEVVSKMRGYIDRIMIIANTHRLDYMEDSIYNDAKELTALYDKALKGVVK